MIGPALFVDLPNVYGSLLRSEIVEPKTLREYFLNWLDFDVLAGALTHSFTGIWVFYSGGRIGPSNHRIDGKILNGYVVRINALEGVTARDVNIPGVQREHGFATCDNCGKKTDIEWRSEKGVDASLIVHMFDTMDSWDGAYLLSGDADYVPAVASLRRRGKIVIGVGFGDASEALIRECYSYRNLCDAFLEGDLAAYSILGIAGVAAEWFSEEMISLPGAAPVRPASQEVTLNISWGPQGAETQDRYVHLSAGQKGQASAGNLVDFCRRQQRIGEFQTRFPGHVEFFEPNRQAYGLIIQGPSWRSAERRLQTFVDSVKALTRIDLPQGRVGYEKVYRYSSETDRYESI